MQPSRWSGAISQPSRHPVIEYDFEKAPDGGDWDEYYAKEARRSKGGRSYVLVGGACCLATFLTLLLTATLVAEEDQSVLQSAMALLGLSSS